MACEGGRDVCKLPGSQQRSPATAEAAARCAAKMFETMVMSESSALASGSKGRSSPTPVGAIPAAPKMSARKVSRRSSLPARTVHRSSAKPALAAPAAPKLFPREVLWRSSSLASGIVHRSSPCPAFAEPSGCLPQMFARTALPGSVRRVCPREGSAGAAGIEPAWEVIYGVDHLPSRLNTFGALRGRCCACRAGKMLARKVSWRFLLRWHREVSYARFSMPAERTSTTRCADVLP